MASVVEKLTQLAHGAGLPLHAKLGGPSSYCRYLFCLSDGTEYASTETLEAGKHELVRLLKLYGPTLRGPGFANNDSVHIYLSALGSSLGELV